MLTEATLGLIALKRQALDLMRRDEGEGREVYKREIQELEKVIRPKVQRDQADWYEKWTNELQEAGTLHNHKEMFGMLQRTQSKGPRPLPRLKRQDGTLAESVEECQLMWRQQFAEIEGGLMVTDDDLAKAHMAAEDFNADAFDMDMIPTTWELQNASECLVSLQRGESLWTEWLVAGDP